MIQSFPWPSSQNSYNSLSLLALLIEKRKTCAQDVAPSPAKQVEKYSKEGTNLVQYNYSPVCHCNARVKAKWKAFVDEKEVNRLLIYNEVWAASIIKSQSSQNFLTIIPAER